MLAWEDLFTGLCLALIIEGVLYALFPGQMQRLMAIVMGEDETRLRIAGFAAVAAGIVLLWLIRGTA